MMFDNDDIIYNVINFLSWGFAIIFLVLFFSSDYMINDIMQDYESGLIKKEYKIIDSDTTYTWKYYKK